MTAPSPSEAVTELRVAAKTPTQELAAAISHSVGDGHAVRLRAIGAGAVNQAVKALIIAQTYVAARGLTLANRPGFVNVALGEEERTAIVFYVFTVNH